MIKGQWSMVNGQWSIDFGLLTFDFGLWTFDFGLLTFDFGLYSALSNNTHVSNLDSGTNSSASTGYKFR
jgi:hypothetical protein